MIVDPDPTVPITESHWAQLRERWPHPQRIVVAMTLAPADVETCAALLRDESVFPSRLDPEGLQRMRDLRLVRLDMRAIDLLIEEPSS